MFLFFVVIFLSRFAVLMLPFMPVCGVCRRGVLACFVAFFAAEMILLYFFKTIDSLMQHDCKHILVFLYKNLHAGRSRQTVS